MSGPYQYGLVAQSDTSLMRLEDRVREDPRLRVRVVAADEARPRSRPPIAAELDADVCAGVRPDGIGHVEDSLARAEVPFESDEVCAGKRLDQVPQVARVRATKPVDALRLVTDDGETFALGRKPPHDVHLDVVDVLVLVDQDVPKAIRQLRPELARFEQRAPEEQKVVEVEEGRAPLAAREAPKELADRLEVGSAPRVLRGHHRPQRSLGVDATRVDIDERGGPGKPRRRAGQALLDAQEVHQVLRTRRIEHSESLRKIEDGCVCGDMPVGDGMEGATSRSAIPPGAHQVEGPGQHLVGRTAGEGEEEDAVGRHASIEQARHARDERPGLAGPRPCDHHERPLAVSGDRQLRVVEPVIPPGGIELVTPCCGVRAARRTSHFRGREVYEHTFAHYTG